MSAPTPSGSRGDVPMVTVTMRLEDARALVIFARLGLVWVIRDRRVNGEARHKLGRGLHALCGAIEHGTVRASKAAA